MAVTAWNISDFLRCKTIGELDCGPNRISSLRLGRSLAVHRAQGALMLETVETTLNWAHPVVAEWFVSKFGTPTEPQINGWPHILAGRDVLISAPTGSGKTLAAFLACIDRLVRKAIDGELEDRTEVVYVSPLKALSNDVQKNLEGPLKEILELAVERGFSPQDVRTAVRTGDTLQADRRSMLKKPPHILVTTPESLYILVTAEKSREILKAASTIIVDEIHAVADDKRGAHLVLTLERLETLLAEKPVRVGLSATQKPIEEVGRFLVGAGRPDPEIVSIPSTRELDLAVEVPDSPLAAVASNAVWEEIYDRVAALVLQHRSTLIFVNTRRLAERVAHNLAERLGEENVGTHHGSLSRNLRLEAEQKLKNGAYRALVATASLELGIDIGSVELVCQLGSPRNISVTVQRIGRSGHWRGATPKGRIFATTRDELIECAALVKAIRAGELDRLLIPECPMDVLAQQIVAICASETWEEDELFRLVTAAYPYRDLPRFEFDRVLEMLSEGIAGRKVRHGKFLHHDRINKRVKGRRGARMAAITNGGAIPDNALFTVLSEPDETVVGTVDEDFAVESLKGDIFLLGNTSWRIRRVEAFSGKMRVEDAHGAPPTVPFWRGEAPGRTLELSLNVSEIRSTIDRLASESGIELLVRNDELLAENPPALDGPSSEVQSDSNAKKGPWAARRERRRERIARGSSGAAEAPLRSLDAAEPAGGVAPDIEPASTIVGVRGSTAESFLMETCGLDRNASEQAIEYILRGKAVLGAVPTDKRIIAERFFDESGGMQLVIHTPFGSRINKAWGLALRKKFCRNFNVELQAAATDNGINISLTEQHSFPLMDVFQFVHPASLRQVLEQTALASPLFTVRWRWDANRALALLRFSGGKKVAPQIQRMRAEDLLAAVFPDAAACQDNIVGEIEIPDHPLVNEVMKDVLTEALDIDGLAELLERMRSGEVECLAVDTTAPSDFSHEILNANPYAYLDDAPLEERRARAVEMRSILPAEMKNGIGRLEPEAIERVVLEALPDLRDADELYDVLMSLILIPFEYVWSNGSSTQELWGDLFMTLLKDGRAFSVEHNGRCFLVAAERFSAFQALTGCEASATETSLGDFEIDEAAEQAVSGWLLCSGPLTVDELSSASTMDRTMCERALLRLESKGLVLRGKFRPDVDLEEWCERGLLSRIHRMTIGIVRKQVEAISQSVFMDWLFEWQHVSPSTRLAGEHGTLEIVRQLAGFEVPASLWESQILANRVKGFKTSYIDSLCLTGAVAWGRLSPHPAFSDKSESNGANTNNSSRRILPTKLSPICFYLRDEQDWIPGRKMEVDDDLLSPQARKVKEALKAKGASFFQDLVRVSGLLKSEVETALWELVTAGLVTADGFDNLRALVDPKRRAGQGRYRRAGRPRHSQGRWSLAYLGEEIESSQNADNLEAMAYLLLRRYGVVFREMLMREANIPRWRELIGVLRRLEAQGKVRGGRFVNGFVGEQFALPLAVESLRGRRNMPPSQNIITVAACDPLNLVGYLVPGDRIPSNSGSLIDFQEGRCIDVR